MADGIRKRLYLFYSDNKIMPKNQAIPVLISVAGFIVLMVGSLGYIEVYPMEEGVSYIMMGAGAAAVIIALITINLSPDDGEGLVGGSEMGFFDKLKALFGIKKSEGAPKEKSKGEASKAAPAVAKSRADEFKGEGKVANALRYGATKIDVQLAAGNIDEKKAALFMASLKDCEAAQVDDDAKLVMIGQVIGAITFL